jgi:hypothetical protein
MDTKLTLKLNKSIIDKAKEYAKGKNISLSKMIENYLQAITNKQSKEIEISPLVESLIGVISPQKTDFKKDYTNYLSKKYK